MASMMASSDTLSTRSAPLRMSPRASSSGTRQATPPAIVSALSVETARPASKDNA